MSQTIEQRYKSAHLTEQLADSKLVFDSSADSLMRSSVVLKKSWESSGRMVCSSWSKAFLMVRLSAADAAGLRGMSVFGCYCLIVSRLPKE